jgi:hypothetical protein
MKSETELLKILFEDEIVILFLKNGPSYPEIKENATEIVS